MNHGLPNVDHHTAQKDLGQDHQWSFAMNQVTKGFALSNQKSTAVISQAELAEMQRLREQNRQHNELRNKLTSQLERGADIEPGPLTAHIDRHSQMRFSKSELVRLLGKTEVTQLQRKLTPTISRYLKIVSNHG